MTALGTANWPFATAAQGRDRSLGRAGAEDRLGPVEDEAHPDEESDCRPAKPEQLPRHEWWRSRCHAPPQLRSLSDAELLAKGADVLCRLMPRFLKGEPSDVPEVIDSSVEEFTHFIEEMNHRGIDMHHTPTH